MRCGVCGTGPTEFAIGSHVVAEVLWKLEDAWICADCYFDRFAKDAPGYGGFVRACERIEQLANRDLLQVKLG